jgi:hypothetical protein
MRAEFPNCRVADTRSISHRVRTPADAVGSPASPHALLQSNLVELRNITHLTARTQPHALLSLAMG